MTESPSLLLQRAAELLEQKSAHFEAYLKRDEPMDAWMYDATEGMALRDQTDWIRMLAPPVAQPLANILRGVAFTLDCHPEYRNAHLDYIALAEAVLGEEKPA